MKRYLVQTFGCQMNVHDSQRIGGALASSGYAPADQASDADVLVLNTCSVREKAEHKLMSMLGTLRPLKSMRPNLVVVVAGCVAQQEGERLLRKSDLVDVVVGPDHIPALPGLVEAVRDGAPPMVRTGFDVEAPRFLPPVASIHPSDVERDDLGRGAPVSAFVTTMKGCDERCTYCVVPYTRGPERYRPAALIVAEIDQLVAQGVREVTLLGQTVNSWHEPGSPSEGSQFSVLLRRIAREVPGLTRLRYTSPHPRHLGDALIAAHAELDVLADHVHLPVQSGSDRILKRMLRRTTREGYLARVERLRAACPTITLTTDFIVGFPGETEQDFRDTLELTRAAGFVAAFAFKYSPRPHTPSRKLEDDVPEAEKDERLQRLLAVVEAQQTAHLLTRVGTVQPVLVEKRGRPDPALVGAEMWSGRTAHNEIVHLAARRNLIGEVVPTLIERANRHSLMGRPLGADDAASRSPNHAMAAVAASPATRGPARRLPVTG